METYFVSVNDLSYSSIVYLHLSNSIIQKVNF